MCCVLSGKSKVLGHQQTWVCAWFYLLQAVPLLVHNLCTLYRKNVHLAFVFVVVVVGVVVMVM